MQDSADTVRDSTDTVRDSTDTVRDSTDTVRDSRNRNRRAPATTVGDAVYGLGLIGALVHFWQQADTGGEHVIAVLKSLVWPAFLVYQAFGGLAG